MGLNVCKMAPHELLTSIGQSMYGQEWKGQMAKAIGVNERTVRRWAAGAFPIPKPVLGGLAIAMYARTVELTRLAREAERRVCP